MEFVKAETRKKLQIIAFAATTLAAAIGILTYFNDKNYKKQLAENSKLEFEIKKLQLEALRKNVPVTV